MKKTALKVEEKKGAEPVLVVDRIGVVGEALSEELSKDFLVFFASKRLSLDNKGIINIPFTKKIPKIPNNRYLKMFIIDDGQVITRESVFSFLEKAKELNSPVYFLGSLRNIDLEHADEIIRSYSKAKVLIFGDLFDNKILFDKRASITKFIIESRRNKKIKVPGEGLSLNYPISFTDTIKLIIKASYISIPEKAILLFARHPITDISLANTFQKIDPEIDVDFEKQENENALYFPKNSQYALAKYDLKKKLSEIDLDGGEEERTTSSVNQFKFKFIRPVLFFLLACLFILLLPLLTTYTYSFLGEYQLGRAKNLAEGGEFEKALKKSENAEKFYSFAHQTSGPLEYQISIIGRNGGNEKIKRKIEAGLNLSRATSNLLEGIVSLENIYFGKSKNPKDEIKNSIESFKSANLILQELNVSGQIPKDLENNFKNLLPILSLVSDSADVIPDLLGFDKEKKYLVLFYDNSELRPGGGVVESAGILEVKNGRVAKLEIIEADSLGSILAKQSQPPYLIRRHLPSPNFSIRDSGNSPDFVTSAIAASSIYEQDKEIDVDGVIGVNSETSKLIQDMVVNRSSFLQFSFFEMIGKGLIDKEILFAFKDPSTQSIFTANNFSGSLVDQREIVQDIINDYFGISETNLGKNKVNPHIARSVVRKLSINKDSQLNSEVKISFKNNSPKETYKNYLQLILPEGSRIQEVSIGGKNVQMTPAITDPSIYESNGFNPPSDLEIEQTQDYGKSIFGFLVLIPPEAVKTVTVNYTLPFTLSDSENNLKYSLIVYKQPGIKSYPFVQEFDFPENFSILPEKIISEEIRKDEKFNFLISER